MKNLEKLIEIPIGYDLEGYKKRLEKELREILKRPLKKAKKIASIEKGQR